MTTGPRIPYGLAKWIVRHMRHGDAVFIRPRYIISFRKAAREEGVCVISNTAHHRGRVLWRMMRVTDAHPSGHIFKRMPDRDQAGHFRPDNERRAA